MQALEIYRNDYFLIYYHQVGVLSEPLPDFIDVCPIVGMRAWLLLWVFLAHLAGIYLFTRGFLLTRLSLSDLSSCPNADCTIVPTHKRAILLIIDALRFDFITLNPPDPPSPFHHNILTLPRELTLRHPKRSFIFNAYADPPTTTLQRIKGITTGSLPTFVDIGNNFGGSSIAEDSILRQMKMAGNKVKLHASFNVSDAYKDFQASWLSWAMTLGCLSFLIRSNRT